MEHYMGILTHGLGYEPRPSLQKQWEGYIQLYVFPTEAQSQKLNPWIIKSERGNTPDSETKVENI